MPELSRRSCQLDSPSSDTEYFLGTRWKPRTETEPRGPSHTSQDEYSIIGNRMNFRRGKDRHFPSLASKVKKKKNQNQNSGWERQCLIQGHTANTRMSSDKNSVPINRMDIIPSFPKSKILTLLKQGWGARREKRGENKEGRVSSCASVIKVWVDREAVMENCARNMCIYNL